MTDLTDAELDAIIEAHAEHWRYKGNDRAEAEIEKIGALARASLSPWREIESAPKDGTRILLCGPYETCLGRWTEIGYWWSGNRWMGESAAAHLNPTHWMPLPPPPSNGEREVMPRASELRADIEQPSEDSAKPLAALPSDPDSEEGDFERAIEEAERRGPNEALKQLMASSQPDAIGEDVEGLRELYYSGHHDKAFDRAADLLAEKDAEIARLNAALAEQKQVLKEVLASEQRCHARTQLALPSDPDEDFEQALEEAERRGPNEALKQLMASPSDPDSPTVRVVCPWCGRNMN